MQLRQPLNLRQPLQMTAHKIRPTLNLPFAASGILGPLITYTGQNGTYFNSSGTLTAATTNVARFDYNPSTLIARGLQIEEARTNLFLNALLDGTSLSTQNVTTAATPYTLSFYGTGTITLSGTSTAGPLVGTGVYPNRVTLTFTPTAGTLTCTVSGSVQYAQIEAGSFATSFIPTAGATVTRAADVASITGANFTSFWNATQGTIVVGAISSALPSAAGQLFYVNDGTSNQAMFTRRTSANAIAFAVVDGGVSQADIGNNAISANVAFKSASAYQANNFGQSLNGGTVSTDTSGTIPTLTQMYIGSNVGAAQWLNGWISSLSYYPVRLTNSQLQTLST